MAIEKNSFKVSRINSEFSPGSRDTMSSEDDELQRRSSAVESDDDDDDDFDDCDSGAGSDDFDLLELGETGEEFCQFGDQTCSIPYELYDLSGLGDLLSMEVWNDVLTEEERFSLAKYLPDMEQETYILTLKELFTGCNLHFGSPIAKLFNMLKGGLCEPRIALYRQGTYFFQKRQHYHRLREHQNRMVANLHQIKDAWLNCRGYSIDEKLRVLNIVKNQKSLMNENTDALESNSSEREEESGDVVWNKRPKDRKNGRYQEFPSQGKKTAFEQAKHGKQNPKGTLKLAGSKVSNTKDRGRFSSAVHHGPSLTSSHHNKLGHDLGGAIRMRGQAGGPDDVGETIYEVGVERDPNFSRVGQMDKAAGLHMPLKSDLMAYGNRTVNQLSDIKVLTAKPSNARNAYDSVKKVKYPNSIMQIGLDHHNMKHQMKYGNGWGPNLSLKESPLDFPEGTKPFWNKKAQEELFPVEPSSKYGDWNVKSEKVSSKLFRSESRAKPSQGKVRAASMKKGGRAMGGDVKRNRMYMKSEETESDSSEQIDDDEEDNPLMRSKSAYPRGFSMKPGSDFKKAKFAKKEAEVENYVSKAKQKGKVHDNIGYMENFTGPEDSYFLGHGRFGGDNDHPQIRLGKNGQFHGEDAEERFHFPLYPAQSRQEGEFGREFRLPGSNYMHDYIVEEDDDTPGVHGLAVDNRVSGSSWRKGQTFDARDDEPRSDVQLLGCNSLRKKKKLKGDSKFINEHDDDDFQHHSSPQQQLDEKNFSKKKGKRKVEDGSSGLEFRAPETPIVQMAVEDAEVDIKPQKKTFTLITPTVHTGFSFSVIHLLSAVRMAMITLLPEDSLEVSKHLDRNNGMQKLGEDQDAAHEGNNGLLLGEHLDVSSSEYAARMNLPSLSVQEIVNRVRSNPGDPCILETQEPLQDLVRGVLKIFSSKSTPLGAKGWKPLAFYEKSTKSWSWIGPVSHSLSDQEAIEEVTSPEAWGLPHKMLVKLVDSFANWLKSGQETLQQIGSLPAPPLSLMQFNSDEKERFRDLRAQKSLSTIGASSEEVRDYFRKEEALRYSIPDRTFSYTAADGRKSIVAPLRRCGGKPTAKARDHFMLKRDRPPHVTILCLVRDAAARLPGSIGTRADVCTLIRDSQYIVEDVPDSQVNQVVSGALDRLHYERDPCVQFDGERKLWVYLHREREEEDFEDDGTSSTKKWKRQKKETPEAFEQGTVTLGDHEPGEQTGIDLSSDLNVEPSFADDDKRMELVYYNDNHVEDNENSHGSEQHLFPPVVGDGMSTMPQNKLLCQENSTNDDFDDETFGTEPEAELLSTSLS